MSYIEESLQPNEKIITVGGVSVFPLLSMMLFGAFLIMVAAAGITATSMGFGYRGIYSFILFAGLYPFFYTIMYSKNTEIGFTDRRFILARGIFRRNVIELDIQGVGLMLANRGLFGRFLNYGTVAVVAGGGLMAVVKGVKNPDDVINRLTEYQEFLDSDNKDRILLNGLPM